MWDLPGQGIKPVPLALARQIPTHYTIGEVQTVHLKWMDFISTKLILKNQKNKQTNKQTKSLSYQVLDSTVVPLWILNPE